MKIGIAVLLCLTALFLRADISIDRKAYSIRISDDGAKMLGIRNKITGTDFASNCDMWEMTLNGAGKINSSSFLNTPEKGKFHYKIEKDTLTLQYHSEKCSFDIVFDLHENDFEYRVMNLKNNGPAITRVTVPAHFTFPLNKMKRFVYPTQANWSMGICFLPSFFEKRTEDDVIYKTKRAPFDGMEKMFNSRTIGIPNKEFKQKSYVIPTSAGERFYNAEEKKNLLRAECRISYRQSNPEAFELKLLRNQNDEKPLLLATRLEGKGLFFQMQSINQNGTQRRPFMEAILFNTASALKRHEPELFRDKKLILIDYPNVPAMVTGFDPVSYDMSDWHYSFPRLGKQLNMPVGTVGNIESLRAALRDPDVGVIINPYGNIFPSAEPEKFAEDLEAIRAYVRRGGIWWESGVRCFNTLFRKNYYAEYDREARYPSAAADFACAEYVDGSIALFGVQPTMRFPYDRERAAIPKSYDLRGSEGGAQFTHHWVTWVDGKSKKLWNSTPYRIMFSCKTPREGLVAYEATLELNKKLEDKVKPEILERLKRAMLICAWYENVEDNIRAFKKMPPNNIAHFIGALASRFDANYPEHLPPDPKWGTLEDLRRMVEEGHKLGHLVMPYTNTTWWLPHEKGALSPSQQKWKGREKEVMALTVSGTPAWRRGRTGVGWALNYYHPYVQKASLNVTEQFASYGCDMIFMDEMGGHPWKYDFNPLEPWPATALDARISMCWDSSKVIPTATEEGHDRLLNFNTMNCGGTWKTFPNNQFETQRYVHQYRPQDWQFWPTFIFLGHDKAIFTVHDLLVRYAGFEEISLALSLGYKMKDFIGKSSPERRSWMLWLDSIQKTVAKEYEGKSLLEFIYPFEEAGLPYSNRVVYSEFDGNVRMVCNHSNMTVPLKNLKLPFASEELVWLQEQQLPPYGFYVSTPNGKCGYLDQNGNLFGFSLAAEKGAYRGAFFTCSEERNYTLPDNSRWIAGTFTGSSGKLNVLRHNGRLEFTVPFSGSGKKRTWWFSHYDQSNSEPEETLPLIQNGRIHSSDKRVAILANQGFRVENDTLICDNVKGRRLLMRLPESYMTMTLVADVAIAELPQKGFAVLAMRPGCNSILGIESQGRVIFTMWYADKKTQNHVISRSRLKPGEKVRIAAAVEVKDNQTTLKLMINGKVEASRSTAQPPYSYGPRLSIAPVRTAGVFIGSIENMFFANTALSAEATMKLH